MGFCAISVSFFSWKKTWCLPLEELYLDVFLLETVPDVFLAHTKSQFLSSLRYWALFWWCLTNSFLCILKMNNQKEGRKNREKSAFKYIKLNTVITALACIFFTTSPRNESGKNGPFQCRNLIGLFPSEKEE